ncbi:hypothetical protein [Pseudomonas leptonychotis]|uniref:hypothetical protein n=1 Tax=Pseudomonas leptonychotis TaxID=2448482 RepID=UPI003867D437
MTREEAYDAVAKLAAEHALILQAFGGLITIVHPDIQRQHGVEAKCLYMAGMGPFPDETKPALEQKSSPVNEEQIDLFDLLEAEHAEQQEGAA